MSLALYTWLLFGTLIQAPAQDKPLEAQIESFLAGDVAAREHLVKLGACAIRPLQKMRDKGPEKIDAFVFDLKKAAAYPACTRVIAGLEFMTQFFLTVEAPVETELVPILEGLVDSAFVDQIDFHRLKSRTITLRHSPVPARVILDDLCRQTGLDYGMFHNHLVISHPERLWPTWPPEKPRALTGEETTRAKELVERLDDEAIETRESATRQLMALGPSILPILEANLSRKESQIVARCTVLIQRLRLRRSGAFGPPEILRHGPTAETKRILGLLQAVSVASFTETSSLADSIKMLGACSKVPIEFKINDTHVTRPSRTSKGSLTDILCLITQTHDLDFMIKDGKIVVDLREAIDNASSTGK